MKSNKVLAGLLTVTFLSLSTVTVLAAPLAEVAANNGAAEINEVIPISAPVNEAVKTYYGAFTGEVKEITLREDQEDYKLLAVENQKGDKANIIITKDTYIINNGEIAVGSIVSGYYDANAPRIMIYPPQYYAEVLVIESQEQNVKVDIFDSDLVSSDHSLKVNISEETEVVLQDGKAYKGELAGHKLAVIYSSSTKSIPAQAVPSQVIVLSEKADPSPDDPAGDEIQLPADIAAMKIVVNDKVIEAPAPFLNKEGIVMLPLRAVAEALGNKVQWDHETQSILVGYVNHLTIGQNSYTKDKENMLQFETAPVLVEGVTFVPMNFFSQVTITESAFVFSNEPEKSTEEEL